MKFDIKFVLVASASIFIYGCGCPKLKLSEERKEWVDHFKIGQHFFYKDAQGRIDTMEITEIDHQLTPCNNIEISEFQYEESSVFFNLKLNQGHDKIKCNISVSTVEWRHKIPYIYFSNLGPHRNDLENKLPIPIDTSVGGLQLRYVYYFSAGLNTEEYGEKKYFKNYFWNKKEGLLA